MAMTESDFYEHQCEAAQKFLFENKDYLPISMLQEAVGESDNEELVTSMKEYAELKRRDLPIPPALIARIGRLFSQIVWDYGMQCVEDDINVRAQL